MIRRAVITALALAVATPVPAAPSEQLRRAVELDLKRYGFGDVDVDRLTSAQLAAIHAIANEKRPNGARGQIRSVLGGRNTLRGLFQ